MTQNNPEPKVAQVTDFSDQQCLVTWYASNNEDWSLAHWDEHVTSSPKKTL